MPEWLKEWWPVVLFAAPLVYGWILWSVGKGVASKEELAAEREARQTEDRRIEGQLKDSVQVVDRRLLKIETEVQHLPTKDDIASLRQELTKLNGAVAGSERELQSISRALTRVEDSLAKGHPA